MLSQEVATIVLKAITLGKREDLPLKEYNTEVDKLADLLQRAIRSLSNPEQTKVIEFFIKAIKNESLF